jgi:hypothetical protein
MEQTQLVLVFDTTSESFRHMRAPVVSGNSDIFEMDGTLGIYSRDYDTGNIDIWVLQNYEDEVWDCKYRVKLPVVEISGQLQSWHYYWDVRVVLADSDVHLMVTYGQCLCYVDTDGKLVASFHRGRQMLHACQGQLKQTLVQHNFFTALQGYSVNPCPFV